MAITSTGCPPKPISQNKMTTWYLINDRRSVGTYRIIVLAFFALEKKKEFSGL